MVKSMLLLLELYAEVDRDIHLSLLLLLVFLALLLLLEGTPPIPLS